jgi:hypothetical protein
MGKLADLAKAKALKGAVQVTFKDGTSKTFASEAEAEKATAGLTLEHRRGAFFEVEGAATEDKKPVKFKK